MLKKLIIPFLALAVILVFSPQTAAARWHVGVYLGASPYYYSPYAYSPYAYGPNVYGPYYAPYYAYPPSYQYSYPGWWGGGHWGRGFIQRHDFHGDREFHGGRVNHRGGGGGHVGRGR